MATKVISYGLPTKSPRNIKKICNIEDELKQYEVEILPKPEAAVQPKDVKEKNKIVTCVTEDRAWTDTLIDYADERFEYEDIEKVEVVNTEGTNGITDWEITIPNPRLISKVKRSRPTAQSQSQEVESSNMWKDEQNRDLDGKRSQEYEFVDAPAWQICIEPSTYRYVANNGRYRASKLAKRIETNRHAKRLQYQQERRMTPEKQYLQKEIQRELRKEFEMYLKLERENNTIQPEETGQIDRRHFVEIKNIKTYRCRNEEADTSGDSDIERFEPKEWRNSKKARIEEPASVLKVSSGNGIGIRKDGNKRKERPRVFPPLDPSGDSMSGDQFLQEVSERLLNWDKEIKKGKEMNKTENKQYDEDVIIGSSREHRSKSEPPTMAELVDRHHNRSGYVVDLSASDNPSMANSNYGSVQLSILGSNSVIEEEQVRYRLPKHRTNSTSIKDQISRLRYQQNSAPNERIRAEPTHMGFSGEPLSKLPPRGESLPIRTPMKALQSPPKKTEPLKDTTFSVRKISNSTNTWEPSVGYSEQDETQENWDFDDDAIEVVSRHQVAVKPLPDTSLTHKPKPNNKVGGIQLHMYNNQASRIASNGSPLNAMAIVNHIRYSPGGADINNVPKLKLSELQPNETLVKEKSLIGNSPRGYDVIIPSGPSAKELQNLMTFTKINNTVKSRKNAPKGKASITHNMPSDKTNKIDKAMNADDDDVMNEDMVIGVSGKKIGYKNESIQKAS